MRVIYEDREIIRDKVPIDFSKINVDRPIKIIIGNENGTKEHKSKFIESLGFK